MNDPRRVFVGQVSNVSGENVPPRFSFSQSNSHR